MSGIPGYVVPKPFDDAPKNSIPKDQKAVYSMYYSKGGTSDLNWVLPPVDWAKGSKKDSMLQGKAARVAFKAKSTPGPGAYDPTKADFVCHPRVCAPKSSKENGKSFVDNAIWKQNNYNPGPESQKANIQFPDGKIKTPKWIKPVVKPAIKFPKDKFPKPSSVIKKGEQYLGYRPTEEKSPNFSFPKAKDQHFITKITNKKKKEEDAAGPPPKDSPLMVYPSVVAKGTKISQVYFGYKGLQTAHNQF